MTDSYEYDAFGNSFTVSGTTPNNYLYRGEQRDADLGLYYLRARYYNPQSGRFTGVDPLTDQGQPRYEYAGADPVNGFDPMGTEELVECAVIAKYASQCPLEFPVIAAPIPPPLPGCDLSTGSVGFGDLPNCRKHWKVRVNIRPILSGKKGCDENLGIPSCSFLPWGHWRHTYVEIDGPDDAPEGLVGPHTWGVLGADPPKNDDQEMVQDRRGNFEDPPHTAPGIQSDVVTATDQQAENFGLRLTALAWPKLPHCPSCGIGVYHNGPIPPIDVVSFFSAFNSNTFTWNAIENWGLTAPPLKRAPGYHYSSRYAGYP